MVLIILGAIVFLCTYSNVLEFNIEAKARTFKDVEILKIVDKIAECESGDYNLAINPDDGGSRSIGVLQFKDETFKLYANKYNILPEGIEEKEIENLMWFEDVQKDLAYEMINENKENIRHWLNCGKLLKLIK